MGAVEIGESHHRTSRLVTDGFLNLSQQPQHFFTAAFAEVDEQDLLPGVFDKSQAVRHGSRTRWSIPLSWEHVLTIDGDCWPVNQQESSSPNDFKSLVKTEFFVRRDHRNFFIQSLRDNLPVERVAVVSRHFKHVECVLTSKRKNAYVHVFQGPLHPGQ